MILGRKTTIMSKNKDTDKANITGENDIKPPKRFVSREELDYLKNYDIANFERPSVATDIAVFSIAGDEACDLNYRKVPVKKLKLLMIKRASYPYKNCWALPGGFCQKGEDITYTAKRELFEETHIDSAYLRLSGVFGEPDRDPRGWIISHSFMALIDKDKCIPRAGSDAWEAKWFDVLLTLEDKKQEFKGDNVTTDYIYGLRLTNGDIVLSALIAEHKLYENYHESFSYEIISEQGFAFDHAKIITHQLCRLRETAEHDARIVFDLMPEYFTLTELQQAFEIILDKQLLTPNFRRKMSEYVIETDKINEGAGHRPPKLFKRNVKAFYYA